MGMGNMCDDGNCVQSYWAVWWQDGLEKSDMKEKWWDIR